jgi:uncharacterized protein YjbI with pentapeptide repeats
VGVRRTVPTAIGRPGPTSAALVRCVTVPSSPNGAQIASVWVAIAAGVISFAVLLVAVLSWRAAHRSARDGRGVLNNTLDRLARAPLSRVGQGRYAPQLWPVWLVAPVWVMAAITLALVIYLQLRAVVQRSGPNGGPASTDPLDLIKTTITVVGFIGAVLVGVYGYRKQRIEEAASRRADGEGFLKRYQDAGSQLGHVAAAVRLAGVYAMGQLADDDKAQRETIVKVLCAYLRMPYDPGESPPGEREVRYAIIRLIADHLEDDTSPTAWCGLDLDFTGAVFDGGSFSRANFTGGRVSFEGAKFVAGHVHFDNVHFAGADVSFGDGDGEPAQFLGGDVSFTGARFTGGYVSMIFAKFTAGVISFGAAQFSDQGNLSFGSADFDGAELYFGWPIWLGAKIDGGSIVFSGASFRGGFIGLGGIELRSGKISFESAKFEGVNVSLHHAMLSGGTMDFNDVDFKDWTIILDDETKIRKGVVTPWPLPNGVIETKDTSRQAEDC